MVPHPVETVFPATVDCFPDRLDRALRQHRRQLAAVIDDLGAAKRKDERTGFTAELAANLVLNGSRVWAFFRAHRLAAATAVADALTAGSADLARRSSVVSTPAAAALTPFTDWFAFATVLSGTMWWRHRQSARPAASHLRRRSSPAPGPA